ncbi:histone deacetylase [Gloeobacter kilaueensis]|uniref:Histone deacetylase superfamily protein n=1 Tax=Gloeobacter kilaueensis (strain ATCC BAA-2537 / CCAP 1431/1 / ULC 316 / JS1) TaxID=1183438 RepID=U5QC63_GLOK1|nr:histone deacetylase [Gloeobacter kilaueensis]AGY56441.1 histone deacetylase superfamily protein [Gloeobacter kilaueensis JS1]
MDLPLVYSPRYEAALPVGHRFPMGKFGHLYRYLLTSGIARPEQFWLPERAGWEWLTLVHAPSYVADFCAGRLSEREFRRIGLPWSPAIVERTCTAVGGTVLSARLAISHGLACNIAGGTHHAFADFGSGFCIFNDLAVAARVLLAEGRVSRVLIVDLDVHQGDGTARIFAQEPAVFTFSMHCEQNFPARKQQSDLDVSLPIGTGDAVYLRTLREYLPDLLDRVRPDLVLYDAGVDPHRRDRLGKLDLSDEGLYERDLEVIGSCLRRRVAVAGVIGGGYDDDLQALVQRHSLLHRAASALYRTL